ncbi:glycoside hydrolase family 88 protein [Nakamurella endophytica]|uniref:Glycosyl hydrolase family 88 n=1 Tax=Nakamurella endophytica TaxID=1748367 RepID=A0A917SUD7_9ACTN|nr:glycoside hydrolase family 88 protein [Nakamurella endophytica]GGL96908.1 hypothetical protein GCM10011594_15850 [Nakamurella endophytica]
MTDDPQREQDPTFRVLLALLSVQRRSWEQGVATHALLDLERWDEAVVMARDAVALQSVDGRLGEVGDNAVNGAANLEAVRWLAASRGDAQAARAAARQLHWLLHTAPRAADGTVFHVGRQVWVDSVYMLVPALVSGGRPDEAARQLAGHRRRLFDEVAGLCAHVWDEDGARLRRPVHWGTGNGWVAAGLARALHTAGHRDRTWTVDAAAHAGTVVDACLAHRAASGLFHDVVDDDTTFEECTLALQLAYTAATGTADGWLPSRYADTARSLLETGRRHVDPDGFVRPVCGAPHFDRPGTSAEGQAFYLLATAAVRRLDS